jgi:hypothetical protein
VLEAEALAVLAQIAPGMVVLVVLVWLLQLQEVLLLAQAEVVAVVTTPEVMLLAGADAEEMTQKVAMPQLLTPAAEVEALLPTADKMLQEAMAVQA